MTHDNFDELFPLRPHATQPARPMQPKNSSERTSPPHQRPQRTIPREISHNTRRIVGALAGITVFVALVFGGIFLIQNRPIPIVLNGTAIEVGGEKTISDALQASGIEPEPGDLVAIDGSVLEAGAGEPFQATINGTSTNDPATKLSSDDVVEIGNGNSIEEPSAEHEEAVPFTVEEIGTGAIHLVEGEGVDGKKTVRTGQLSGKVEEWQTEEPVNLTRRNVFPSVGGEKVIALTFDDGPWPEYTAQILDVLAKYGAKATFFTVGSCIQQGEGTNLVKRAAIEGHQICTHTFDHASGSGQGVNLGYMTPEERITEVEQGYAAIEAATGTEASRVIRAPGGNFGPDVAKTLQPLISADIGWNIDPRDWNKPGVDAIAAEIESAWPGAIVLLHDGGGDRSQTAEALKKTLPRLKQQGYRFITIDELMSYPLI